MGYFLVGGVEDRKSRTTPDARDRFPIGTDLVPLYNYVLFVDAKIGFVKVDTVL